MIRGDRKSCYSVESTLERGAAATSPLYVGGSKSLENLIREARVGLGRVEGEEEVKQPEEIYMDMRGGCAQPTVGDQLLRAEV